jgi:hypothetical protein
VKLIKSDHSYIGPDELRIVKGKNSGAFRIQARIGNQWHFVDLDKEGAVTLSYKHEDLIFLTKPLAQTYIDKLEFSYSIKIDSWEPVQS